MSKLPLSFNEPLLKLFETGEASNLNTKILKKLHGKKLEEFQQLNNELNNNDMSSFIDTLDKISKRKKLQDELHRSHDTISNNLFLGGVGSIIGANLYLQPKIINKFNAFRLARADASAAESAKKFWSEVESRASETEPGFQIKTPHIVGGLLTGTGIALTAPTLINSFNDRRESLRKNGSDVINKYASEIIDEHQLETLLKWVEKNPGKTSLAAAGGLLGLTGLAAGIGAGIGIPMSMISKGIAKEYPTGNAGVVAEHPYLSNLASQAVLSSTSLVHPSLGILNLARPPIEQSLGQKVLRDVDAGKSDGVLGKFTRKNPRLGSFASAFIPGAGLNSVIAGRSIAEQAQKDKSFMYRHPIIGAIGGSLIPGNASSYYNAAADILTGEV